MKKITYTPASRICRTEFYKTTKKSHSWAAYSLYILGIIALCAGISIFSAETPYSKISTLDTATLENFWKPACSKSGKITTWVRKFSVDSEEKVEINLCIDEPLICAKSIAKAAFIATQDSSVLELAWIQVDKKHRDKKIGSKIIEGLIECARTCNFNSIELTAQCIDDSVKDETKKEFELTQRYLSVLHFYAKYDALAHPYMGKPLFTTGESVKNFSTPLIIPLNTQAKKDIKKALIVEKIKKQKKTAQFAPQPKILPAASKNQNPYSLFFIHTYKKLFEKNS